MLISIPAVNPSTSKPPPPASPSSPPLFKGITESGTKVEVRPSSDGGTDIVVDGTVQRHETVPWHLDPDMMEPFVIGPYRCREVFEAPEEAFEALDAFHGERGAEPPREWRQPLVDDGIINEHFALTPRGRRALMRAQSRKTTAPRVTHGVLAADASRARLFILGDSRDTSPPTLDALIEVSQITRPESRAKDADILTETRPGLRTGGKEGPQHGVSDRRDRRRHAADERFAEQVAEEAVRIWKQRSIAQAVVVASPPMLGLLRPAIGRAQSGAARWVLNEMPRNLAQLTAPQLHDALSAAELLPARGRFQKRRPKPGSMNH
jgi:protein required for attachment to host cells